MLSRNRCVLIAIVASCFAGALSARANLLTTLPETGDLLRWSAFSLGGGITTDQSVNLVGTTDIYGDVGVAGNGNITMTGNATIHGDLYYRSNGTLTQKGNSRITGNKYHNQDSVLDNGVNEAIAASNHAAALAATPTYASIGNIGLTNGQSMTLSGSPGQTVVLSLQNFTVQGGTLTLQGAATTNFVLNITKQFSVTAQSQIVLSGGVTWDNVLFNIRGTGKDVTISAQSTVRGIVMANNRLVTMDGGSIVYGSVIANQLSMVGGSQINRPPISSP